MSFDSAAPWSGRAANRWGHWGSSILIASIGAVIVLGVHPLPPTSPVALWLPLTLLAFVIVSWLMMRQHDRRLCEHCMSDMPLDAAQRASRYRRRFALAHAASSRRLVIAYLVVLVASNGLLLIGPPWRFAWALMQTSMIYLVLSYSTHRRLQPWCPWCRGGNGDDDRSEAPDPMPRGTWQPV